METSFPALECTSAPNRSRLPRALRVVIATVFVVGVTGVALTTGAYVHAQSTPDFWSYVRTHRADDALVRPIRGEGRMLAESGAMAFGADDPFAMPESEREGEVVEIVVKHGDEPLLRFRHALAYVFGDDGATRTALAMRTEVIAVHPELRARVRIGVGSAERLVGPNSAHAGSLTYDVTLLAGGGESTVELVEAQAHGDGELEGTSGLPFASVLPWTTVPEEGLVHRVRHQIYLMAGRTRTGAQSIGYGTGEHSVNTTEYSYDVDVAVRSKCGDAHSWRKNSTLTWNGVTK